MRTGVLVATGAAAVALAVADTAYRTRTWGAYAREINLALPGDELIPEPAERVTRAITVHAPPDEVWPWLAEIARVRGGLEAEPGRSVVLPEDDAVRSFHLLPVHPAGVRPPDGARCRLVTRTRTPRPGRAGRVVSVVLEPLTLVMTRRMLLGVKERAERSAARAAVAAC